MTMTREEAIERLKQNKAAAEFYAGMVQNTNAIENELKDIEAIDMAIQALSAEAEPIEAVGCEIDEGYEAIVGRVNVLPSVVAVDCTDFIRWLTETVMDDGKWEMNAVAYGEVIARKLTKLGVLEVKDDVYVYEPSAEPKTGEWIKTVSGNGWNDWWVFKCPFCGTTIEDKQYRSWEYNFCPNCGARMYKGGDDE